MTEELKKSPVKPDKRDTTIMLYRDLLYKAYACLGECCVLIDGDVGCKEKKRGQRTCTACSIGQLMVAISKELKRG